MRGPIVRQYDERTYCTPVMMRGPIVRQYDERTYCTPVMMRGPIVRQLCERRKRLEDEFQLFSHRINNMCVYMHIVTSQILGISPMEPYNT